ncbi:MAG: 4-alpha-glucanotransferase [Anaerolineae bacterium]|nr:4-alpha-glucanotransferase [Anaerolineae bacterium]
MRFPRAAGILLHPTSLPGGFGIGELGETAYQFVDFLVESGQSLWQMLPLGPTGYGDSPYACFSAFAGNPLLINLKWLAAEGDIAPTDLAQAPDFPQSHVDFGPVIMFKMAVLHRAARKFHELASRTHRADYERFCMENANWLEDFALFMALKDAHGGAAWNTWEWELASRQPQALDRWRVRLDEQIFAHKYFQYQFFRQWEALKRYTNDKGIHIIGDIPIFVAYDSVDVWAHPDLFYLDDNRLPTVVAGVPPDYFSPTGQLWGNPIYRWDEMAENGFQWWIARFKQTLRVVDLIRLDHFRGFAGYWEIPAGENTAINGVWKKGPGVPFFEAVKVALGDLPILAEDLGHITPDVEELRDYFSFPGMNVLQFAFATDAGNPYLPHNLTANSTIYTGTHDNQTTVGWYKDREKQELEALHTYLGPVNEPIYWALIRMAYRAVSNIAIVPLQDILGLGDEARMNTPGKLGGNWSWRFQLDEILPQYKTKLSELALTYGRKAPEEKMERPKWM